MNRNSLGIIYFLLILILTGCQKDHYNEMKKIYENSKYGDYITVRDYLDKIPEKEQSQFEVLINLFDSYDAKQEIYLKDENFVLELENNLREKENDLEFMANNDPINLHYFYQLADENGTYVGFVEEYASYVVINPTTIDYLKYILGINDGSSIPAGTHFYGYFNSIGNSQMVVGNLIEQWKIMNGIHVFLDEDSKNDYYKKLLQEVDDLTLQLDDAKANRESLNKEINDLMTSIDSYFKGTEPILNNLNSEEVITSESSLVTNESYVNEPKSDNALNSSNVIFSPFKYKYKSDEMHVSTNLDELKIIGYNPKLKFSDSILDYFNVLDYSYGYCFELDYYTLEEEIYNDLARHYAKAMLNPNNLNYYFNNLVDQKNGDNKIEFVSVEMGQIATNGSIYIVLVKEKINLVDISNNSIEQSRYLVFHYEYTPMEPQLKLCEEFSETDVIVDPYEYVKSIEFIPFSVSSVAYPFDTQLNTPLELNKAGMMYYEMGRYELAASMFKEATNYGVESEEYEIMGLAYYNLSCTLSILAEKFSNYDNVEEILLYLETSFVLKPDRIERSKVDTDLDYLRKTNEFKRMMQNYN